MQFLYKNDPASKKEAEEFEKFTSGFVSRRAASTMTDCFVIPVVFHVYGTTQSGLPVNNAIINSALAGVNADFHGTNSDFNTVHSAFSAIKASMPDITFALAQFDPQGNPTSGIIYHPVASGYGNSSGYDALIAADAWDNYRYMNVYVQNDLYANNVFNNSGIAWYPNTNMSTAGTARVVYNGAYLSTNTNAEFASTLTHEFAHWLNLIHTFEGGCSGPNDFVNDTPSCDFGGSNYVCHSSPTSTDPVSCGHLVNAENYMDYSGAGGCYKMFTTEQTWRVYAALQHPARFPIWQPNNVIAAGLWSICSPLRVNTIVPVSESLYLFPSATSNEIHLEGLDKFNDKVYGIYDATVRKIRSGNVSGEKMTLDVSSLESGIYFFVIGNGPAEAVKKFVKVQ